MQITNISKLTVEEKLSKAKIRLLMDYPFFGYLALNLNVQEKNDMPMPTACVDAFGNMFYDKKFIEVLNFELTKSLITHELLHCALSHLIRVGKRDMEISNIAMDVIVQNILVQNNFRMIPNTIIPQNNEYSIPNTNITIKAIDKKNFEEIYEELQPLLKQKEQFMSALKELLKKVIDKHIFSPDAPKGSKEYEQQQENAKRWKKLLIEASVDARLKGKIPAGLERYIERLKDGKFDWRTLLYRFIVREIPFDYAYTRPAKRSISAGYFIPSVIKENINIVVSIDLSGSINQEELSDFLSEIVGISKSFQNISMTILFCDCQITDVLEVKNGNMSKILNMKMKGGGGTSHHPIFQHISEKIRNTKLYIGFTDGFSDIESIEPPNYKVLWVIPKNGFKGQFHFGDIVRIER